MDIEEERIRHEKLAREFKEALDIELPTWEDRMRRKEAIEKARCRNVFHDHAELEDVERS